jgi:transcriptional regulator with AAA-type ATPase domain
MGGIADSVFEAEMFGHVRGAFTDAKSDRIGRFEAADGGTLFLDEIANIPVPQQAKLLRVVEDGELERVGSSRTLKVDVRLIAATNADLAAEVAAGRFRKDLLFRLNTVEIHLPALRERREDIIPLAQAFLWLLILHALDTPNRHGLLVLLVASLVLVSLAGVLSISMAIAPWLLLWASPADFGIPLDTRPRTGEPDARCGRAGHDPQR